MNAIDVALICKALGDANRLEIVQMLSDGEKCGCKLLERFEITQPTLSHYLRVADLMGITSPYPRENIIAGNYILADTQAFLSKCHRQQNKEILIRHSPGIGECFLLSNIQLTEKIKKISSGGCKNASQRFVLMKGYLGGKNKKLSSRACIYALHLLNICKDIFEPA